MVDPSPSLDWRPQLDNPTFLGWSVVAAYVLAALVCGGAARIASATPGRKEHVPIWSLFAALLVFLGVNKQLNLQTLLLVLGRRAASAGGWYERRRLAQAVFSMAFALAGGAAVFLLASRAKAFFGENPLAWRGLTILTVFVLLRAATINHVDEWLGVNLYDDKWCWVLEICGSFLLGLSAFRFIQSQRHE
ncbi:MAG: hypothetical protein ACLQVY_05350 [Limisphaerales bacterium]